MIQVNVFKAFYKITQIHTIECAMDRDNFYPIVIALGLFGYVLWSLKTFVSGLMVGQSRTLDSYCFLGEVLYPVQRDLQTKYNVSAME